MFFSTPQILIFVVLLLIHYGVDGVQPTGLNRRADSDHNPDHDSTRPGFTNTSPNTGSPLPTAGTSISSTSTSLSSNASSLATSASNSAAGSRKIATIVGAVLGSVILAGLGLMIVAHFRRRARKARRQPQGSSHFNEPTTDMSQTLNGSPLNSSTPLVQSPLPLHFFNGSSISTNNTSSLTPLMRGATSMNATSSFHRPLSTSEFGHSDLHTHPSLSSSLDNHRLERPLSMGPSIPGQFSAYDLSPDTPLLRRAVSAGPSSSQFSSLHREMAGFQKSLEANHKREISGQSQQSTNIISDPINDSINELNDPPPKYIV